MASRQHNLKLPAKLVDELGGQAILGRKSHIRPTTRKEHRKAERDQKKAKRNGPPLQNPNKRRKIQHELKLDSDHEPIVDLPPAKKPLRRNDETLPRRPKSILKHTGSNIPSSAPPEEARSTPPTLHISQAVRDKLAEDDEDIAALEKKLGLKGKKLPQSFKDDGLDDLLDGLGGSDEDVRLKKRQRAEGDNWLKEKRWKAQAIAGVTETTLDDDDEEDDEFGESDMALEEVESIGAISDDSSELASSGKTVDDFEGFESDSSLEMERSLRTTRVRENPYIAPDTKGEAASEKYTPPSLRKLSSSNSEALVRLRRQTQGLVNRLTEANLISLLGDIEKLYRDNPRQHVTSSLVDLLLTSVCEPTSLPDTLIILPAGFIAAIYKVIGTDFGAQVVQRIVELFDKCYVHATSSTKVSGVAPSNNSKETSNLITLLAEMYTFQVIGSNLIFDYIRLFLEDLSELNAELLLKVIRAAGAQLRRDDPSSLKDIVSMLRPAVATVGEENLSVRTKFMIETINDLKNNRMKTGAVASGITSEHTVRMKKTLGSLNTRNIKASEPLRMGLKDVQGSDKKGKWWLVGASWLGNVPGDNDDKTKENSRVGISRTLQVIDAGTSDLVQLAREQRMNTDIRRAIFVTTMSASDYHDAYLRLMKLKLKRVQELEIPKVLIHCSGAEKNYNPYYTLIAKKLCGDRRIKMAFQFSLWDLFKRMGETEDEEDIGEDEEEALDTRCLVNLAKMFGNLIADGGLGINVLKNLNLSYLQPKTKTFIEVLLITILLQSQRQSETKRDEQAITGLIAKAKDTPQMVRGLQYFLKKVVGKTDIAGGRMEKDTVKWACKIASKSLESLET
ncbi:hypothetical protein B7494_g4329 [Chlorociboria aeruginascens]|nr:hypothetical protein B7494_g4329 [Chlorociboria aeruginascens]